MMADIDLFGTAVPEPSKAKRKPTPQRGYAAPPGSGPADETCGSCEHHATRQWAGTYHKCALMVARWTRGPGSDILVRSPACSRWEARELNIREQALADAKARPLNDIRTENNDG